MNKVTDYQRDLWAGILTYEETKETPQDYESVKLAIRLLLSKYETKEELEEEQKYIVATLKKCRVWFCYKREIKWDSKKNMT